MSFTSEVKQEIAMNELHACCVKAELSALVQMLSSINFSINGMDLRIKCEHAPTAKRIFNLIKERYQAKMQFSVMKKMKLKKNNVYILRVSSHASEILEDLEILTDAGLQAHISKESLSSDCCMRAYLAGAFLAGGSVNAPKTTNYHLEISTSEESHAEFLQALMNEYYLGAKMIKRRNQYVVYIKASDHIGDFLRLMGTSESLFKFEDARIQRDLINSLKRLDNCELANEMKSIAAGAKQLEDIQWIDNYYGVDNLPEKLKHAALARMALNEGSLNELCDYCESEFNEKISKSGMKHRLAKLKEMANQMRENQE